MKLKATKKLKSGKISIFYHLIIIILAFLMQVSIFPLIPFFSATPNLLLIVTFSFGFIHGSVPGMFYGLFAGLLMDLFYSGSFGFYSFIFVFVGYMNGLFSHFYYEEYITLPVFMCVFNELLYHIYIYVFRFLIRGKFNIVYYFLHIIFPSIIFSLMLTLLVYRFLFSASRKMESL